MPLSAETAQQKTAVAGGPLEEASRMASRRRTWLLARITVYLAVIVGLILYKGGVPWRQFTTALKSAGNQHPTLVIAGRDLAPPLVERLAAEYRRDYPALDLTLLPGGTNQALEALLAGQADIAFTYRRPTAAEQDLFRQADGDTAIVQAVGVAGLLLLAGADAAAGPVAMADVRAHVAGLCEREPAAPGGPYCDRLYACDPNEGSWDALLAALGLPLGQGDPGAGTGVVFVADPAAVAAAVAADARSWGVVSILDCGFDAAGGPPPGTTFVGVVAAAGEAPVSPVAANVATGGYPLHHFLYVACRAAGSLEGGKFLTHLSGARGLRQVERAGVIPARLVAREIQLSRDPIGGGR